MEEENVSKPEIKKVPIQIHHKFVPVDTFTKNLKPKTPEKKNDFIKIIIILIPLIIFSYIGYANFLASHEFNYDYDIGGSIDQKTPYLTPADRMSEVEDNMSRNITSGLVYFTANIPRDSDEVLVQIRFKDNFPTNTKLLLGIQNNESWSYTNKIIFDSAIENINQPYKQTNGFRYYSNSMVEISNISDIPNGAFVANNFKLAPEVNEQQYNIKDTKITTTLRGGHTFYVYLNTNMTLIIKKQDLNGYNGTDDLTITLYDINGNHVYNSTIPDDGIINADSKTVAKIQVKDIYIKVNPGVYRLVFSDFDGLIREIDINTNKIVTNKLFLADSNNYNNLSIKESTLYTKSGRDSTLTFRTYHSNAYQNVTINDAIFKIDKVDDIFYTINKGEYTIISNTNDLIVSSQSLLAFSKESYFEPFTYYAFPVPSNTSELKNYDYVILNTINYESPMREGDWLIGLASFDLGEAFIKDGKLSFLITTPHLSKDKNYSIPIDYINITVNKDGIFQR